MEDDPIERAFREALEQRRWRIETDFGHKCFQFPPFTVSKGLVLQFIGGPLNNTQQFVERTKYPFLRETQPYRFPTQEGTEFRAYDYVPTFIPLSETPFSDDQVVILLYRG